MSGLIPIAIVAVLAVALLIAGAGRRRKTRRERLRDQLIEQGRARHLRLVHPTHTHMEIR